MNNEEYFLAITAEIHAIKNRVRNFIQDHWLSDGEWKESVLRSILRRHLPKTIGIGNGFIFTPTRTSTQIDILLYDNTKPVLFQDGDFVIVTPDCVKGIIEVKTTAKKSDLDDIFSKIADNIEIIPFGHADRKFFGVFIYHADFDNATAPTVADEVLEKLYIATRGQSRRVINSASIGESFFIRYWFMAPEGNRGVERWHAYKLKSKAPAYFLHNVIEHLCPESVLNNNAVWYPESGKEDSKISERCRKEE